MQAEGIKGDLLHVLVNKLLRDKKSTDSEQNQCNQFVQVDILRKPAYILMEFFPTPHKRLVYGWMIKQVLSEF